MVNYGSLQLLSSTPGNISSTLYSGLTNSLSYYTSGTFAYSFNIRTNVTTPLFNNTGLLSSTVIAADNDSYYIHSGNYPGPGRSPVAFFKNDTTTNNYLLYSNGTFWNNNRAYAVKVSNKWVMYYCDIQNQVGYIIFNKSQYLPGSLCTSPVVICNYPNVVLFGQNYGGVFTSDDTYFYAAYGRNLIYYYLYFSTTTQGGSTGPLQTYTFEYNIINIVYAYALRVLILFTSTGFYFFNPNNINNTKFYSYPNNLTANYATAPSNMPLNNTNMYYYFIIDPNNILYQLPIYFNPLSNNYSTFPFIFNVNLTQLSITSVSQIQCSYTGETLCITASNRIFIFQYTLPYIDGVIENAVVF